MKPVTVVDFCKGAIAGHIIWVTILAYVGYYQAAAGVYLLGLGWVACAMVWEKNKDVGH